MTRSNEDQVVKGEKAWSYLVHREWFASAITSLRCFPGDFNVNSRLFSFLLRIEISRRSRKYFETKDIEVKQRKAKVEYQNLVYRVKFPFLRLSPLCSTSDKRIFHKERANVRQKCFKFEIFFIRSKLFDWLLLNLENI